MDSSCHAQGDIVYEERAESRSVPLYLSTVERVYTRLARDCAIWWWTTTWGNGFILHTVSCATQNGGNRVWLDVRLWVFCFIGLTRKFILFYDQNPWVWVPNPWEREIISETVRLPEDPGELAGLPIHSYPAQICKKWLTLLKMVWHYHPIFRLITQVHMMITWWSHDDHMMITCETHLKLLNVFLHRVAAGGSEWPLLSLQLMCTVHTYVQTYLTSTYVCIHK